MSKRDDIFVGGLIFVLFFTFFGMIMLSQYLSQENSRLKVENRILKSTNEMLITHNKERSVTLDFDKKVYEALNKLRNQNNNVPMMPENN